MNYSADFSFSGNKSADGGVADSLLSGSQIFAEPVVNARVLLDSVIASNVSSVSFVSGIDSTYDSYEIEVMSLVPSLGGTLVYVYLSDDNGNTYKSSLYKVCLRISSSNGSGVSFGLESQSGIRTTYTATGNGVGNNYNATFKLINPSNASVYKYISFQGWHTRYDNYDESFTGAGSWHGGVSAINGIKFAVSSGNIVSGIFKLYGLV